jgi:hypothetical protein
MMKTQLRILSLTIAGLTLLSAFCNAQQKETLRIKEGYAGMVGYGSLMSLKSMESTLGYQYNDSAYIIHLNGFVRAWTSYRLFNDPKAGDSKKPEFTAYIIEDSDSIPFDGIVQLNVEYQENSKINCILYILSDEDIINFDKREFGYERVDVTDKVEEYSILGGKVYVYQQVPGYYDTSVINLNKFILIEDYVNMITKACDEFGENFRMEFDKTTLPPSSQVVPSHRVAWKMVK